MTPQEIISNYCEAIGLPEEILLEKGAKKRKVYEGLFVSSIRNALAYYLLDTFPHLSQTYVCRLVGYNDHTTWSKQWRIVKHRIETKEKVFYPYWECLMNCVNENNEIRTVTQAA